MNDKVAASAGLSGRPLKNGLVAASPEEQLLVQSLDLNGQIKCSMYKILLIGICLIFVVVSSSRAFSGEPANAGITNLSIEAQEHLQQLAVGAATNATNGSTNTQFGTQSSNTGLIALDTLDDAHKLGIGDRVSYRVIQDKEEPKLLSVADSGELELPYLGRVAAEGKTCMQLAAQIKAVLEKKYYYHATVVLSIDSINKIRGKIYLAGRVIRPGPLELPTDEVFTVSKAILLVGGFGDFADKRHVMVTRKRADHTNEVQKIEVDVAEVLEKGQSGKDFQLAPDDNVYVPSKLINF